jgi:hypothetical protein
MQRGAGLTLHFLAGRGARVAAAWVRARPALAGPRGAARGGCHGGATHAARVRLYPALYISTIGLSALTTTFLSLAGPRGAARGGCHGGATHAARVRLYPALYISTIGLSALTTTFLFGSNRCVPVEKLRAWRAACEKSHTSFRSKVGAVYQPGGRGQPSKFEETPSCLPHLLGYGR